MATRQLRVERLVDMWIPADEDGGQHAVRGTFAAGAVRSRRQGCYSASGHGRPSVFARLSTRASGDMNNHPPRPADPSGWRCPLCNTAVSPGISAGGRSYARCPECALISLDPVQHPLPLDEVVRYTEHRNLEGDEGYRRFLGRLSVPVTTRLARGAHGLDFGCGPAAVLADILTKAGFPSVGYDPLFAPREELLARQYDFITCSEVIEHLHQPSRVLALFGRLLGRGGVLGVMTRFHRPEIPFETWWYRRDSTHVCFYAEATMHWIASHHGWTVEIPSPDVALFDVPALAARASIQATGVVA